MLDLEERNEPHTNQPDFGDRRRDPGAATRSSGSIPAVTPTARTCRSSPTDPAPARDRPRVRPPAAERNGFVFYIEPVTFGVNKAYWGPVIRAASRSRRSRWTWARRPTSTSLVVRARRAGAGRPSRAAFVEPFTRSRSRSRRCRASDPAARTGAGARAPQDDPARDRRNENPRARRSRSAPPPTSSPDAVPARASSTPCATAGAARARLVGVRGAASATTASTTSGA